MVVPQLVEQSLPIPEVRGLIPGIGKIYFEHFLSTVCRKDKHKEREAGNCYFFKKLTNRFFTWRYDFASS